jgi:hypothetical protein
MDVTKITPAGVSTTLGSTGHGPYGITVDPTGNVYVANAIANTVSRITPAGASTVAWASTNTSTGPRGIVADGAGNVFTANYGSNDVTKIAPDPAAAPTELVATAGDASASVAFTAGADNGWAITNYEYSIDDGSTWTVRRPAGVASPIAITGLTNGTTYSVKLRAVNSAGAGAASAAVRVTPAASASALSSAAPSKPSGVSWSTSTVITTEPLVATFTATPGTTYEISATPQADKLVPVRSTKIVRGACAITTKMSASKRVAKCTIRNSTARAKYFQLSIAGRDQCHQGQHGYMHAPTPITNKVNYWGHPSESFNPNEDDR